eukprot:TRINITY_DN10982_c0_g1_i1.p1 TRINITY_DN10982_c0_g1~~TRINITY_DN10982_c0_g1_i1.p1  ORF type:complete len:248 (+),score=27.09 TRINITY_DN10982_c0_g1_i1:392-1135(+)
MYAITKETSSKTSAMKGGGVSVDTGMEVQRIADILSSQLQKCIKNGLLGGGGHRAGSVVSGAGEVVSNDSLISPLDEGLVAIPDFPDAHNGSLNGGRLLPDSSDTHTNINNGNCTSTLENFTTNTAPFSAKYNSLRGRTLEAAEVVVSLIRQKYKEERQRLASSVGKGSGRDGDDCESEGSVSPQSVRSDVSLSCLLYTSDAADEEDSVDLSGRRIIKKKRNVNENSIIRKNIIWYEDIAYRYDHRS